MPPVLSVFDPGSQSNQREVIEARPVKGTPAGKLQKPWVPAQARLRCAYLQFNPDFKCPFPLCPFVFDQWALCSFTFFSFFHLPCLFNLFLHPHPHPPNSPPTYIPTSHHSKGPSQKTASCWVEWLSKASYSLFSCCVVFSCVNQGFTHWWIFGTEQSSYTLQVVLYPYWHRPREWEDDEESVLESEFLLSAADFHAHIFRVYAKLFRALCKISSFSSLILTPVHALMTLKAKGCFFRHNSAPAVSQVVCSQSAFSTPDHFCLPILWLMGCRRRWAIW